jgi:hypothetical protein
MADGKPRYPVHQAAGSSFQSAPVMSVLPGSCVWAMVGFRVAGLPVMPRLGPNRRPTHQADRPDNHSHPTGPSCLIARLLSKGTGECPPVDGAQLGRDAAPATALDSTRSCGTPTIGQKAAWFHFISRASRPPRNVTSRHAQLRRQTNVWCITLPTHCPSTGHRSMGHVGDAGV